MLRAIAPEPGGVQLIPSSGLAAKEPVAWPAPIRGGREWTTTVGSLAEPEQITPNSRPKASR